MLGRIMLSTLIVLAGVALISAGISLLMDSFTFYATVISPMFCPSETIFNRLMSGVVIALGIWLFASIPIVCWSKN